MRRQIDLDQVYAATTIILVIVTLALLLATGRF
jgi:hypothetical protein